MVKRDKEQEDQVRGTADSPEVGDGRPGRRQGTGYWGAQIREKLRQQKQHGL